MELRIGQAPATARPDSLGRRRLLPRIVGMALRALRRGRYRLTRVNREDSGSAAWHARRRHLRNPSGVFLRREVCLAASMLSSVAGGAHVSVRV